jgi:uncharacterized protein
MIIRRRSKKRIIITGSVLITILTIAIIMYSLQFILDAPQQTTEEDLPVLSLDNDPLTTEGYTKVKLGITPGKVYFVDNCTALVMTTSRGKTFTIQRGLEKSLDIRPDSYDLAYDIMENYGIAVKFLKIEELKEGVYYATILIEQGKSLLSLDAKPSDAAALATRFGVPVYVETNLLMKYGERVC